MSVEVKISVSVVVESTICPNHYLMVVEETPDGIRINQPSGHLEVGETPEEGAIRECKEESGLDIKINGFIGCYLMERESNGDIYLRMSFHGTVINNRDEEFPISGDDILEAKWMHKEEIEESLCIHRSPMVLRSLEDYVSMLHNGEKPECVIGVTTFFLDKQEVSTSVVPSYRY